MNDEIRQTIIEALKMHRALLTMSAAWDEYRGEQVVAINAALAAMEQPQPAVPESVREALAAYAHEAWSGWMRYMFSKGECRGLFKVGSEGEIEIIWVMPAWAVERWKRQMRTEFSALPEQEKQSDYDEADKILSILSAFGKEPDDVAT